jgi:AcrR family transcriptional regulator
MLAKNLTEKKQENILNVAGELFLERGYDAVSLDDILERVGGSKTTLYSYYGGKEGLFAAMVRKRCEDKLAPLHQLSITHLDPQAGLSAIGVAFLSILDDQEGRALYRMMIAEADRFPELAVAFYTAGASSITALLRKSIENWQTKGMLGRGNAEILAIQFLGIMMGDFSIKSLLGLTKTCDVKEIEEWVAHGVTLFLEGASKQR